MGRALVSVWSALFLAFFGSLSLSSCCWAEKRQTSNDKARQEIERRVTLIRLTAFLGQVKSPKPILGLTVGRVNPVPGGHTVPTWHGSAMCHLPVELVAGPPIGQFILVGDLPSEQEPILGGLLEGCKIPVRLEFIGGLVVVVAVVIFPHPGAKTLRLPGKLGGVADGKSRDAAVGERKMVGAEVVALLRLGVGRNGQIQALGDLLRQRPDGGPFGAGDDHILGAAPRVQGVVVEIDGGLAGGIDRMADIVFRSLKAAFLG